MSDVAALATENTLLETLGIRALEASPDRVVMELDVTARVHQPMGLLHGGATAALAETAASIGAYISSDPQREYAVGTDLNISHLRARRGGTIRATATPIRKGRTIHVWNVDIADERGVPVAVARCTLAIRPHSEPQES
ncbi:MAG: PaaI family thioesterase [Actinomycetota bacterium]|nr:PaaI family thioesterase [Actinomycetota bacterium]